MLEFNILQMIKKQSIILCIEIVVSYVISYDMTVLYIVTRYNGLRIALVHHPSWLLVALAFTLLRKSQNPCRAGVRRPIPNPAADEQPIPNR
jgi:hypothetical protein